MRLSNRKVVPILAIVVSVLVPLALIQGVVNGRASYRAQAHEEIARSWTAAQTVLGPVLSVPDVPIGNFQVRRHHFYPETLKVQAELIIENRRRGIHSVPIYTTHLKLVGEFNVSEIVAPAPNTHYELNPSAATLSVALTDTRGIVPQPSLLWAGGARQFVSGSGLKGVPRGVQAAVGPLTRERYPFEIEIVLRGMESLQFVPVGADTRVVVDGAWPDPGFVGAFQPVEHRIDDERFTAEWRVSKIAGGIRKYAGRLEAQMHPDHTQGSAFGVSLIEPADVYPQVSRAVKYGVLFVILTFTALCLIEYKMRLTLHPLQYVLVGLALAMFYLLLLALSEHLPFGAAYLVASIACLGLVGVYLSSAMGSPAQGKGMTVVVGGLLGMLFAIVKSEDNALLMGSLLLFAALAAVMLVTRRVDWYRAGALLGQSAVTPQPEPGSPSGSSSNCL